MFSVIKSMSSLFIKSFENSQLNTVFKQAGYESIDYKKKTGMPPRIIKMMTTPSTNLLVEPLASQTISFKVPRVGHLLGALIQWTYTSGAAMVVTSPIGFTIAKNTVFNCGSYPLFRQSDAACLVSKQTGFIAKSMDLHALALPLHVDTYIPTAGTTSTSFTNLHVSFFEDEENLFDCQNNIQSTIDCLINDASGMGIPDATILSALTGRLFTFHVLYDTETENMLLATNRAKGTVQAQLGVDSSYRSIALTASPSGTITINSNACLRQLAFRVRDTATATRSPHKTEPYKHFSLSVNGEFLHYQIPRVVANFLGNTKGFNSGAICNGIAGGSLQYEGLGWTVLPFGYDVMDRSRATGMMALKNLQQVEINVFDTSNFEVTDILEYVTEEWVMYEFDIYSGEVSIAISS